VLSGINLSASGPPRIQVLNALRGIFGAGYGSSSSMWGLAMRVLVDHGLLDRPQPLEVTATVVNELIRYDGAVQAVSRAVCADTVIGDREVRRGDTAVVVLASANRDPDVFARADTLDLTRKPNPHIGFGKGIHACLGCHLGMRIGVQIFSMLARNYRITLLEEPVQRPTATLRGLDRLMLRASPR
jgi:cytochrome P450